MTQAQGQTEKNARFVKGKIDKLHLIKINCSAIDTMNKMKRQAPE